MEQNEIIRETLCLHEAFRKLGFSSDSIFVVIARVADPSRALMHEQTKVGDLAVHVQLKAQGLEYIGAIGPIPCEDSEFNEIWNNAVKWFNQGPEKELQAMWDASRIHRVLPSLLLALQDKGFRFTYKSN